MARKWTVFPEVGRYVVFPPLSSGGKGEEMVAGAISPAAPNFSNNGFAFATFRYFLLEGKNGVEESIDLEWIYLAYEPAIPITKIPGTK